MSDPRITAYADAAFGIARAEGNLAEVEDELFRLARVLESSEELRSTLTDPHLPASRRQQIVEDLLEGRATTTTIAPAISKRRRCSSCWRLRRSALTRFAIF